jgi:hypothetical protein
MQELLQFLATHGDFLTECLTNFQLGLLALGALGAPIAVLRD